MGNASGKEEGGGGMVLPTKEDPTAVTFHTLLITCYIPNRTSPPARSRSSLLFSPQVFASSLQRGDGHPIYNSMLSAEIHGVVDFFPQKGIPTLISWSHGGNDVAVEGSWDNWKSKRILQRSGKDHSLLLVLPSGIYHYRYIIDGQLRYMPDLPYVSDKTGHVFNVLNVHSFPGKEDYAKDPVALPSQLHQTVFGSQNADEASAASSSSKPQHVVLNHLFIEKGWTPLSVVALGLTHRFQSKYATAVLYKPLKR